MHVKLPVELRRIVLFEMWEKNVADGRDSFSTLATGPRVGLLNDALKMLKELKTDFEAKKNASEKNADTKDLEKEFHKEAFKVFKVIGLREETAKEILDII